MTEGFLAFEIQGESYMFPLPRFTETRVCGWGPGEDGEFAQRAWSPESIAAWERRRAQYERACRRWGWLHRLPVRVPMLADYGWDEDGERVGRRWGLRRIGPVLAERLTPDRPGPAGSHLVTGNMASDWAFIGTEVEGVTYINNMHEHPPVGDGVTDATAGVQDAFTMNMGSSFSLPPGRYLITDTLEA